MYVLVVVDVKLGGVIFELDVIGVVVLGFVLVVFVVVVVIVVIIIIILVLLVFWIWFSSGDFRRRFFIGMCVCNCGLFRVDVW